MSEELGVDELRSLIRRRLYTGEHEMQVCETGDEGNLYSSYTMCTKNPGHASFIPVKNFTLDHLPEVYRDQDILQAVKALAELTIHVAVSYTSLDRPLHYPGLDVEYPFYSYRGRRLTRYGTGLVDNITKYTGVPCPCEECRQAGIPKDTWAEFEVFTASHVVFDDAEALETKIRLFYDDHGGSCVVINDVTMWESDVEKDKCRLICVTHDVKAIDRLLATNNERKVLCHRIRDRYWDSRDAHRLTVIVSHPHGCHKHVSVGEWRHRNVEGLHSMYTYTTPTCPGSSGAYVYVIGSVGWWYEYVHKGVNGEGTNFSGEGLDPDFRGQ